MDHFIINGIFWRVEIVDPDSPYLIDRTNQYRLATTDPNTKCIYLSNELSHGERKQSMAERVLIHELGHCVIFSYDLFDDIHRMVKPEYWIEAEEWVCNFIADYGFTIFSVAKTIYYNGAFHVTVQELEKLVA